MVSDPKTIRKTSAKPGNGPPITTLATEVQTKQNSGIDQQRNEVSPTREVQSVKGDRSQGEICKVCSGKHAISRCTVFPTKSLNWRRQFARSNALCYRCLSTSHVRKRCPVKKGCMEKDCSRPLSHHSLLHVPWVTPPEMIDNEKNVDLNPKQGWTYL